MYFFFTYRLWYVYYFIHFRFFLYILMNIFNQHAHVFILYWSSGAEADNILFIQFQRKHWYSASDINIKAKLLHSFFNTVSFYSYYRLLSLFSCDKRMQICLYFSVSYAKSQFDQFFVFNLSCFSGYSANSQGIYLIVMEFLAYTLISS